MFETETVMTLLEFKMDPEVEVLHFALTSRWRKDFWHRATEAILGLKGEAQGSDASDEERYQVERDQVVISPDKTLHSYDDSVPTRNSHPTISIPQTILILQNSLCLSKTVLPSKSCI
jgi:hypothetical protein